MINQLLRRLQIRQRLWVLVTLTLAGFVFLTVATFNYSSLQFVTLQKSNTQIQVEGARKIIDYFYQRSQSGELTRAEAKKQALTVIETLRPDERTYFYIYHASNFILMHPFLKSQTYSDEPPEIVDLSGKQFIAQLEKHAADHKLPNRIVTPIELFNMDLPGKKAGFLSTFIMLMKIILAPLLEWVIVRY